MSPRHRHSSDGIHGGGHDEIAAYFRTNVSKINANASTITAEQRSATPTHDASALFLKTTQDIKRRKKHKQHKSFTNKNDFAEFEYKEKSDHHSFYVSNMQIGAGSGDIFAEFQEAAESLSRRKVKSKTKSKTKSNGHSHSHSNSRHNHIHSTSHSKHMDENGRYGDDSYSKYMNAGPTGTRRSQKSQRSHRSASSQNKDMMETHVDHDAKRVSKSKKRRSTSNKKKNKTPRPDPYDVNAEIASDLKMYTANREKYDRFTVQSSLKSSHPTQSKGSKGRLKKKHKNGKIKKLGLNQSNSMASHNSSTGSRNSFGSRTSSAYNHKNHHLKAKSIKSNGSPRSITTRSITMVSASEEYSVDNTTAGVRSSYYENDRDKSVEDRYSQKSGKSY